MNFAREQGAANQRPPPRQQARPRQGRWEHTTLNICVYDVQAGRPQRPTRADLARLRQAGLGNVDVLSIYISSVEADLLFFSTTTWIFRDCVVYFDCFNFSDDKY